MAVQARFDQAAVGTPTRYAFSLRVLHWLLVALIVAQIAAVWSIPEGDTGQSPLWAVHGTIGPLILLFALIRLGVRLTTPIPPLPDDLPAWQHTLARVNQWSLYLLMIVMPLTGWAIFSVHGNGPLMFGFIQLPPIVSPAPEGANVEAMAAPYETGHYLLATLLLILMAAHVAGAVYHGLIRRDGVVSSMADLRR